MKSKNRHKGHKHKNKHGTHKKPRVLPSTLGSGHMSKRALAARTDELNKLLLESAKDGSLQQVRRAIKHVQT